MRPPATHDPWQAATCCSASAACHAAARQRPQQRSSPRPTTRAAAPDVSPPRLATTTHSARQRRARTAGKLAALSPTTPGPEIWVGAAIPAAVFALGAWEFTKRILIQRACPVCAGTGLVTMGGGRPDSPSRLVKCRACGGFFPWQSWERFLSSAPGNGGPLQQPTLPRQAGVFYRVPSPEEARAAAVEAGVAGVGEEDAGAASVESGGGGGRD